MKGSSKLMAALDDAAASLLKRHFPKELPEGAKEPDSAAQIKAFDAVVKYYGPRTKLGNDEEKKENGIDELKRRLHGRGASGRRAYSSQGGGNGAAADDTPAGSA